LCSHEREDKSITRVSPLASAEERWKTFLSSASLTVALSACDPQRHLASIVTAAAVHLLLGTANLVFWDVFVTGDALVAGYVTTSLHWVFVGLQLFAAATASPADRPQEG
jgi:hypothetical protein